jgi:hypothetical protein
VNPPRQIVGPAFVLDAQALSLLVDDDRQMTARLALATRGGFVSAISTVTIVEQRRDGGSGRGFVSNTAPPARPTRRGRLQLARPRPDSRPPGPSGRWCIPWDPAMQEIYRQKVANSFRLKPRPPVSETP